MAFNPNCILFEHRGPSGLCADVRSPEQAEPLFMVTQVAKNSS